MKSMIPFFSVLLSSTFAFGAVEFLPDSLVPKILQDEIVKTVSQKCSLINDMNWAVREVTTQTRVDRVDNGLTDFYYLTVFEVDAKESDSNHSRRFPLNVQAVYTSANNGPHYSVDILEGCL